MEFSLDGRIKAMQIKSDEGELVAVVQIEARDVTPDDLHQLARAQQATGLYVTFESAQREFREHTSPNGQTTFSYDADDAEPIVEEPATEAEADPLACDLERAWEDGDEATDPHEDGGADVDGEAEPAEVVAVPVGPLGPIGS